MLKEMADYIDALNRAEEAGGKCKKTPAKIYS